MAEDRKGRSSGGHGVVTGDTDASKVVVGEAVDQSYRGIAGGCEFIQERLAAFLIGSRRLDVGVLIEISEWRFVVASDPKGAIDKDALGIDDVLEDLFDGPLALCIPMQEFILRGPRKEADDIAFTTCKPFAEGHVGCKFEDVASVVWVVFVRAYVSNAHGLGLWVEEEKDLAWIDRRQCWLNHKPGPGWKAYVTHR